MVNYSINEINKHVIMLRVAFDAHGWEIVEHSNDYSIILIARAEERVAIRFFSIDDPNIRYWLPEEETLDDSAPLWYSENSHQVSPLYNLREYLDAKGDDRIWTPVVILLPDVKIVNLSEILCEWIDVAVVPFSQFEQALENDSLVSLKTDVNYFCENFDCDDDEDEDEDEEEGDDYCFNDDDEEDEEEDDDESVAYEEPEILPTIESISISRVESSECKSSHSTLARYFRPGKGVVIDVKIVSSGDFPPICKLVLALKSADGTVLDNSNIVISHDSVCSSSLYINDLSCGEYKLCISTMSGKEFYRTKIYVIEGAANYAESVLLEAFALARIDSSEDDTSNTQNTPKPSQHTFDYRNLEGVSVLAFYKNITLFDLKYQFVTFVYNELGQLVFESEESGEMDSGEIAYVCSEVRKIVRTTGTYTVQIEFFGQKILEAKFVVGQRDIVAKFRNKAIEPRGNQSSGVVHEVDDPMAQLNAMVGLTTLKKDIKALLAKAKVDKERESMGLPTSKLPLHMAFLGNPGTGKTTVAKLLGQLYKDAGLLSKGHVVIEERSTLCGQNWNTETENTLKAIEASEGGILFIDEAYELVTDHPNDPGKQVLGALMSAMADDSKRDWMVIMAGYTQPMERLLSVNSGLRSRTRSMYFKDYNQAELMEIVDHWLGRNYYRLSEDARTAVEHVVASAYANRDENFGNARYINTLFEREIQPAMAERILAIEAPHNEAILTTIEACDVPNYNREDNSDKAIAKLNDMVGLESLKSSILKHLSLVRFLNSRRRQGILTTMPPMHMVFTGNPGTGKTTVADYLGEIYRSIGILRTGNVIKVTRADLVDTYVGGTEKKMNDILTSAHGNILFIDEAYTLAKVKGSGDVGYRALELLLDVLGRENCDFITILAGYPVPMDNLLSMNPGLKGRFPYTFHFEDYNEAELCEIADGVAQKNNLTLTAGAKSAIEAIVTRECRAKDDNFSNARMVVRLITTQIMPAMAARLEGESDPRKLCTVLKADVPISAAETKMLNEDLFDEEAIAAALKRLDSMVGLGKVKQAVRQFVEFARALNSEGDKSIERYPLKWSFVGNTGTGKSSVAEVLSELLKAMHLLGKGHTVEVKAEEIYGVNSYQANELLQRRMQESQQGLLFVDGDAPQFKSPESKFDPEYLRMTLATNTAEIHGRFAVVIAEHVSPRIELAKSLSQIGINDFDHTIFFDDYTVEELLAILEQQLAKHKYTMSAAAKILMSKYITSLPTTHANARTMKLLSRTLQKRARIAGSLDKVSKATVAPFQTATNHPITRRKIGY